MADRLITQNERYASALAEAFSVWEQRGRGWHIWDYAVNLEPPFCPITVKTEPAPPQDDARIHGGFRRLFGRNLPRGQNAQLPSSTHQANARSFENPVKSAAFYRTEN